MVKEKQCLIVSSHRESLQRNILKKTTKNAVRAVAVANNKTIGIKIIAVNANTIVAKRNAARKVRRGLPALQAQVA